MNAFLWFNFCVGLLAVTMRLLALGSTEYPRIVRETRGSDATKLAISFALWAWVAGLLLLRKGGAL